MGAVLTADQLASPRPWCTLGIRAPVVALINGFDQGVHATWSGMHM
jgi:hypothetical protein